MSRRSERVGNLVRNTLGELLLSKMSDPRVEPALTSITRVTVPEDLLTAKVYISVIGTEAQQRRTLRGLQEARGRLQEMLANRVELRNTPVLEFVLDTQFKKTLETYRIIDQAMNDIRQNEEQASDRQDEQDTGADRAETPEDTDGADQHE